MPAAVLPHFDGAALPAQEQILPRLELLRGRPNFDFHQAPRPSFHERAR